MDSQSRWSNPLGDKISDPAPSVKTVTATVGPGTLADVLNRLCALDSTFTWIRIGNTVNVLPSALAKDPNYFLNRRSDQFTFKEARDAQEAVFKTAEQLPGPKEQIAILQPGVSLTFPRPWTANLNGITVREVFDQIAQQFGPSYGWQFSGAMDFRLITFHQGLQAKPSRKETTPNRKLEETNHSFTYVECSRALR